MTCPECHTEHGDGSANCRTSFVPLCIPGDIFGDLGTYTPEEATRIDRALGGVRVYARDYERGAVKLSARCGAMNEGAREAVQLLDLRVRAQHGDSVTLSLEFEAPRDWVAEMHPDDRADMLAGRSQAFLLWDTYCEMRDRDDPDEVDE